MQIEIDFLIHFLHRISATDTASLKNTQKKPINQKSTSMSTSKQHQ